MQGVLSLLWYFQQRLLLPVARSEWWTAPPPDQEWRRATNVCVCGCVWVCVGGRGGGGGGEGGEGEGEGEGVGDEEGERGGGKEDKGYGKGGEGGREKGRLSIERSKVGREQTLKHRKVSYHKYHTLVLFPAPNQPQRGLLPVSRAGKEGPVTLVIIPCSLQEFV